jgi:alkaline phosphatase D
MKLFLFNCLVLLVLSSCTSTKQNKVLSGSSELNSEESKNKAYILLISIDGYRWDYTKKYKPKFLSQFMATGASLKSLRPAYPTKTFPNHISIITGKYPMNHGIVSNSFYAPDIKLDYSLRDRKAVKHGPFYQASPFWSLTNTNKIRSATMFWPGSEAKIKGHRPSYYLNYEHKLPHEKRIETVNSWFNLPEDLRPHFVSLYFSDVDSAGHKYGPDSHEVKVAIDKVDRSIEILVNSLKRLDLDLNIIIVSDHGMARVDDSKTVSIANTVLSKRLLKEYNTNGNGPLIQLYRKPGSKVSISTTIDTLNSRGVHFSCYSHLETPKKLNFSNNRRIGDIVCIADKNWYIYYKPAHLPKGSHGWSQFQGMDMHGILYASGSAFKTKYSLGTQENIHVYPLMAKILNLKAPSDIDGELKFLKPLLR